MAEHIFSVKSVLQASVMLCVVAILPQAAGTRFPATHLKVGSFYATPSVILSEHSAQAVSAGTPSYLLATCSRILRAIPRPGSSVNNLVYSTGGFNVYPGMYYTHHVTCTGKDS